MKKPIIFLVILLAMTSCIINNSKPQECDIVSTKVTRIIEGSSNDIKFYNDDGDHYYINRGLERGLNLDSLNAWVLNKTVTLHLPKMFAGSVSSNHIAQLALGDDIVFTEFD